MMRSERLVFSLQRQVSRNELAHPAQPWTTPMYSAQPPGSTLPSAFGAAVPMDNSILYLGETCIFDVTLSNQGSSVSAVTIKVECSVEGGSTSVLYDNSQSPLQQLPFNSQEQLRVQADIKEQGLISIVASAVFTDPVGERKYHVQFFKFSSASPVSVRTRVRHLPHVITATTSSSSSGSIVGCSKGKTRCFLEVNVQNSTQLVMQLHAVRLLAAAGVLAQEIAPISAMPPPQQQQQQQSRLSQPLQAGQVLQHDQQQQTAGLKVAGQGQLAPAGALHPNSSSDTELLQDIDTFTGSNVDDAAPSVQQKQQQQQQPAHGQQQQQVQQLGQGQGFSAGAQAVGPAWQQQQQGHQPGGSQAVPLPAGCSHNSLWQIDHQLSGALSAASSSSSVTGADPGAGAVSSSGPISSSSSSSNSSSTLGRLELHWSTCDGRTGRLLTQPLTGPVPASGKEVLMQLHELQQAPAQPPGAGAGSMLAATQQTLLTASLAVNQPFIATFMLTAGSHDMGPLLVLYTSTGPPGSAGSSSECTGGGPGGSSSSSGSQQPPTDTTSLQAYKLGRALDAAGCDSSIPEVVVQGSRSKRVAMLPAGQSVEVPFELLPLRRGWLRLPTFAVATEAGGRLLDGVHDVHILVL